MTDTILKLTRPLRNVTSRNYYSQAAQFQIKQIILWGKSISSIDSSPHLLMFRWLLILYICWFMICQHLRKFDYQMENKVVVRAGVLCFLRRYSHTQVHIVFLSFHVLLIPLKLHSFYQFQCGLNYLKLHYVNIIHYLKLRAGPKFLPCYFNAFYIWLSEIGLLEYLGFSKISVMLPWFVM